MRVPIRKAGKYVHQKIDPTITEGKFLELKKELEILKKKKLQAMDDVSRLAELGDFSENAAYQFAKGRLRGINSAIERIQKQIDHAEIIPQKPTDTVQLGHKVTVEVNGKQKTFQILGSTEVNPDRGIISQHSPIGSALLGHEEGDVVIIKLVGKEVEYKILKIEYKDRSKD